MPSPAGKASQFLFFVIQKIQTEPETRKKKKKRRKKRKEIHLAAETKNIYRRIQLFSSLSKINVSSASTNF